MRNRALSLSLLATGLCLSQPAHARLYERDVHIITSNYDLVDTTYIDRGRLNGVKVGDKFQVKFPDGKLATQVVVTGVFERMASVKIVDSWMLKDGQTGNFAQRPMVVALERRQRRPAPDITVSTKKPVAAAAAVPAAAAPAAPAAGLPAESGLPAADAGLPPADAGLPGMDAGGLPASPDGLPAAPDAGGLPPAPDAGMGMDGGLPPAPDAGGLPPAPDAGMGMDGGLPPADGPPAGMDGPPAGMDGPPAGMDGGLPPAPDAGMGMDPGMDGGLPPAPDSGMGDPGLPPGDPGLPPL